MEISDNTVRDPCSKAEFSEGLVEAGCRFLEAECEYNSLHPKLPCTDAAAAGWWRGRRCIDSTRALLLSAVDVLRFLLDTRYFVAIYDDYLLMAVKNIPLKYCRWFTYIVTQLSFINIS